MYRIKGLSRMTSHSNVIVINKIPQVELDFDFPAILDSIDVILPVEGTNDLKITHNNNKGNPVDFMVEDVKPEQNVVVVLNDKQLDRWYKSFNSMHKPPLLLVVTGVSGDQFNYEIVNSGRIFDVGVQYVKTLDLTKVSSNNYKLKCAIRRINAGMYFIDDMKFIKQVWNSDKSTIANVALVALLDYIKDLVEKDAVLKTAIDNCSG